MADTRLYRHHEVQALSPRQFRPAHIPVRTENSFRRRRSKRTA
jgi:hypothetical protein